MKKNIILAVMVICFLVFVSVIAFSQTSPSVNWEYRTVRYTNDETLNSMGKEGWELVQFLEIRSTGSGLITGYNCAFKRRLP